MKSAATTILVVEDEIPMLNLLKQVLESEGHQVLTATDGVEAIQIYSHYHDQIDLVLCDIALPRLDGWSVFLRLRQLNPRLKMILNSGQLDPKIKGDMMRAGVLDFIAKPFAFETIVKSVRDGLRSHPIRQRPVDLPQTKTATALS